MTSIKTKDAETYCAGVEGASWNLVGSFLLHEVKEKIA